MRSLRSRLLASHLAVALTGTLVAVVIGGALTSTLVGRQLGMMRGAMGGGQAQAAQDAVRSVLPVALAWGAVAAAAVAAALALLLSRRIVAPLTAIQEASHRIARGDYRQEVPRPHDAELAAVAADLEELAERLARSEETRARLIDEVAHEMRTPLTTIRGTMEALADQVIEPSPEAYERVAAEASRLERLAQDLSTLSRADEHAVELRTAPEDLAAIARDAATHLEPQFDHAGVRLEVDAGSPVPVVVDRDRITQILLNLLGNALTHTPAGGSVTVAVGAARGMATVRVVDTGAGLTADELDRVFDRFYRGAAGRGAAGRGIGLTIARSLARAHGGDVTASSPGPGAGAAFVLSLPTGPDPLRGQDPAREA
ncbi:HAMP domain-containing sensor histidine kinase [Demequina sp. SYSU T00039]|uniref:Sensor-like histidine kinase SenX3 n=1 Tax=Demequina lignilytica TaxID=3051663 RepID=A0AAW7M4M0_9MICO|nr:MULTISPECIES: HAMP domain-containing sensor histidine kinase [unclassified Demequina]MDN4477728.1 HAMP domain-containing sensor histidine kinase [Demequina sp. SYSU T00039-1]MDN4487637.1 HAMP domain-containing sensor histidine kinase [Demequina sp. SYSU T00039]